MRLSALSPCKDNILARIKRLLTLFFPTVASTVNLTELRWFGQNGGTMDDSFTFLGIWTARSTSGHKFLQPQSYTSLGLFQNGQDFQDLEGFPWEGVKKTSDS